jgi:ABC-2 type transport system ATP-binding protein
MIYAEAHKGTTLFVTTHYMDEAEYCDRVSIMVEGHIEALDTPKNLKQQYQVDSMNDVFLKLARNVKPLTRGELMKVIMYNFIENHRDFASSWLK